MLNECDIRFQTSVEERIAALRIFGLWLVLIFCEKRITAYSEKNFLIQVCKNYCVLLAYERTKDKDDVDDHEHLNGSESISLN